MTNFFKDHAALQARHPIPDTQVYGYQVVTRRENQHPGYEAYLFAVTTDGRFFSRRIEDPKTFHNPKARWLKLTYIADYAEYIGTYDASPILGQHKGTPA